VQQHVVGTPRDRQGFAALAAETLLQ